jgi:hypothetical protein
MLKRKNIIDEQFESLETDFFFKRTLKETVEIGAGAAGNGMNGEQVNKT